VLKAKIPRKSLMSFYWHLHYCLSAGLDAGQAIQAFLNRGLSTVFRRELDGILKHYQHGALLSFAFDKQTLQDRSMVISLLKAAEASGQYAQIFSGLAHYQAWKIDMTDKIARLCITLFSCSWLDVLCWVPPFLFWCPSFNLF